ncbi:MAG: hypothetical protein AB8I08_38490 [Sandaracinaceae bacterium]
MVNRFAFLDGPLVRSILSALAVVVGGVVVLNAPAERTLGTGIQSVYVHVSLTWAGLALAAGFVFAATAAAIASPARFTAPLDRMYGSAVALLLMGLVASFIAASTNWGAIQWTEPRTLAVVKVLIGMSGAWVIVRPLSSRPRFRLGALATVTATLLGWLYLVPRVLHPEAPVGSSGVSAIKAVFYGLTTLWLLVAAMWVVRPRSAVVRAPR